MKWEEITKGENMDAKFKEIFDFLTKVESKAEPPLTIPSISQKKFFHIFSILRELEIAVIYLQNKSREVELEE